MNNGGAAFAGIHYEGVGVRHDPGMSRRQWLAGLAMQALIPDETLGKGDVPSFAYGYADCMLAYEEKEKK